jgi:hypothetical protein
MRLCSRLPLWQHLLVLPGESREALKIQGDRQREQRKTTRAAQDETWARLPVESAHAPRHAAADARAGVPGQGGRLRLSCPATRSARAPSPPVPSDQPGTTNCLHIVYITHVISSIMSSIMDQGCNQHAPLRLCLVPRMRPPHCRHCQMACAHTRQADMNDTRLARDRLRQTETD